MAKLIVQLPRYEVSIVKKERDGRDGCGSVRIQLGKEKIDVSYWTLGSLRSGAAKFKRMLAPANKMLEAKEQRLNSNILDEIDAECAQYEAKGPGRDSRKLRQRLMKQARKGAVKWVHRSIARPQA